VPPAPRAAMSSLLSGPRGGSSSGPAVAGSPVATRSRALRPVDSDHCGSVRPAVKILPVDGYPFLFQNCTVMGRDRGEASGERQKSSEEEEEDESEEDSDNEEASEWSCRIVLLCLTRNCVRVFPMSPVEVFPLIISSNRFLCN
jgi:hypothetical protein